MYFLYSLNWVYGKIKRGEMIHFLRFFIIYYITTIIGKIRRIEILLSPQNEGMKMELIISTIQYKLRILPAGGTL